MTPMRKAAQELLPKAKGVFLRCDRGEHLYVTNAPARTEKRADWEKAGFLYEEKGGLAFLDVQDEWNEQFLSWAQKKIRISEAARQLGRANFGCIEAADRMLFVEGIKRLEMKGNAEEYDRLVRQRAAVCLRKRQGGGTLPACAMIVDMMRGGWKDEDSMDGPCLLCGGDREGHAHRDRPV